MRTVHAVSAAALMLAVPLAFAGCSTPSAPSTSSTASSSAASTASSPAASSSSSATAKTAASVSWADEATDTADDKEVMSWSFSEIEGMEALDAHDSASATKYPDGIWDKAAHVITPDDEADVWKVFAREIADADGKLVKTTMNADADGYVRCAWKAVRNGDVIEVSKVVCRWDRETGVERCRVVKLGEIRAADDTGGDGGGEAPATDA